MTVKFRCSLSNAIKKAQKYANESRKTQIIQAEGDKSLQIYDKNKRYFYGNPLAEVSPERKKKSELDENPNISQKSDEVIADYYGIIQRLENENFAQSDLIDKLEEEIRSKDFQIERLTQVLEDSKTLVISTSTGKENK